MIENVVLRNTIADLYERRFKRIEITEDVIFDYHDRTVAIMERKFESTFYPPLKKFILLPKSYDHYMADPEFNNALSTLQSYRRALFTRYDAVDSIANEVQLMIRTETKSDD